MLFDSGLTFYYHAVQVIAECKRRVGLLQALSGRQYGAVMETLRVLYLGLIQSKLEFCASSIGGHYTRGYISRFQIEVINPAAR